MRWRFVTAGPVVVCSPFLNKSESNVLNTRRFNADSEFGRVSGVGWQQAYIDHISIFVFCSLVTQAPFWCRNQPVYGR